MLAQRLCPPEVNSGQVPTIKSKFHVKTHPPIHLPQIPYLCRLKKQNDHI